MPKQPTKKKIEKAGRGGNIPPKEHRFSKTHQPTREARCRGQKKYRDRETAKKALAEFFLSQDIKLRINGRAQSMPVLKAIGFKVRDFMFNPDTNWSKDTFMAVMTFFKDFFPPNKEDISGEFPVNFVIQNIPPEFQKKKKDEDDL